jgi:hypothetical protein
MGGGKLIPDTWQKPVALFFYLAIGCFGIFLLTLWVILLLGVLKLLPWIGVSDPPTALFVFALSVAVMCVVLWAGAQIQVLKISGKTQTGIWFALITATLTAIVGGVVKVLR